MMRTVIVAIAAILVFPTVLFAQKSEADFYFVYITHDQSSSPNLIKMLRQDYRSAIDEDQHWVFWLANGNEPVIVEVSPGEANEESFNDMLELIGRNQSLEYFSDIDIDMMTHYFNEKDFINDNSELLYNSVSWRVYTTPTFWQLESRFFPKLYWTFDMETIHDVNGFNFTFEVYLDRNDELDYNVDAPFGEKNLGDINNVFQLMDYDMR